MRETASKKGGETVQPKRARAGEATPHPEPTVEGRRCTQGRRGEGEGKERGGEGRGGEGRGGEESSLPTRGDWGGGNQEGRRHCPTKKGVGPPSSGGGAAKRGGETSHPTWEGKAPLQSIREKDSKERKREKKTEKGKNYKKKGKKA